MQISHWVRRVYNRFIDKKIVRCSARIYSDFVLKRILKGTKLIPISYDERFFIGQATHPDILKKDGKYYLTVSSYPFEIEYLENPYVFGSDDGINFYSLHEEAVDAYMGTGKSHFSDGDIISDSNDIVLYYRFCENEKLLRSDDIYIKTYDGKSWSARKSILSFQKDKCLSPAVVKFDGQYEMYYAEMNSEWGSKFMRLRSDSYLFDSYTQTEVHIDGMPEGRMLWHIDVVLDHEVFMGLFALSIAKGGVDCRLYYGCSMDNGNTWKIIAPIETGLNNKWIKRVYRSSMVKIDGLWNIYISVCTTNDCWYVLLLEKQKLPVSD